MGKAVACQLAEKGANVVIVARTVKKLEDSFVGLKVRVVYHSHMVNCTYFLYFRPRLFTLPNRDSTTSAPTLPVILSVSVSSMKLSNGTMGPIQMSSGAVRDTATQAFSWTPQCKP